jgi:conjugal transfer pilus assembly protein TraW
MSPILNKLIMGLLMINLSTPVYAKNLGKVGQTYPILEEDFLDFIMYRLNDMQKTGKLQIIQKQFGERVAKHADRPVSIKTLATTKEPKSWQIDPSIVTANDIYDSTGKVIIKSGTTINPLQYVSLRHPLIFFNGDDEKQVILVKKVNAEYFQKAKLILINGSISEQAKTFQQPIYFDQEGRLTAKFAITHAPALVIQDGKFLKIMEIVP